MMYITIDERLNGLRGSIYKRKSQEDKKRQVLSLETQEDICNDLVSFWNIKVKDTFSESKSAKTPGKRPKFDALMQSIEKGEIDVIICWKIDRLVRNMKEGGWVIDLLQREKLKAIITKDKVFLPEDNTIITAIEMAGATEFSAELTRKVHEGNAKKARKGIPNNYAILGYLNNKHKEQGKRDWRDDPKRWTHLKIALDKILNQGWTPYKTFLWLKNEVKLTTPKHKTQGGNLISSSAFYRFLKRTEIAGFRYYKGEKMKLNGCITPMITEDEYWRLQKRLGLKGIKRTPKTVSTYSGYIKSPEGYYCTPEAVNRVTCDCKHKFSIKKNTVCGKCGLDVSQMKTPIFYHRKYYYNCERKRRKLKAKGVVEKELDDLILRLAESISMDAEIIEWSQYYINEMEDKEIKERQAMIDANTDYVQQLEKRKLRLKNAFLDGVFSIEEYQAERSRIEELEHQTSQDYSQNIRWKDLLLSLINLGAETRCIWKNGDIEQKRMVLARFQSNLIWDEEKLSIYKPKWLETLIFGLNEVNAEIRVIEPKKNLINQYDLQGLKDSLPALCRMWDTLRTEVIQEHASSSTFKNAA